jgi:hypothetical protein
MMKLKKMSKKESQKDTQKDINDIGILLQKYIAQMKQFNKDIKK